MSPDAQRIIAAACGSTALACSMHLHVILAAAWRFRRGDTSSNRRCVVWRRPLVLVSTGGNDWTKPTAVATPVDGGWKVSGRKMFGSHLAVGERRRHLRRHRRAQPRAPRSLPSGCRSPRRAFEIDETWDSAGMRGTGSHDIVLEDVFIAEAR